ncbi:capsular biosynthesis protein [Altererythrobacter sp. B11]|nr:capsular biosynthesis protein [Altererythrobacter sp. B11]
MRPDSARRHDNCYRRELPARRALAQRIGPGAAVLLVALALCGCSSLGASGPQARKIGQAQNELLGDSQIAVVELTDPVARQVMEADKGKTFAQAFGNVTAVGQVIGRGDTLDISIWEAPPATLFGAVGGSAPISTAMALGPMTMQNSSLPPQMVAEDGTITIPFVGSIAAAGLSAQQLQRAIVARLQGKAHMPQVMVRVTEPRSASVTVVGDVANSAPVPLTSKGERILDALASAGGVKQPTSKTTLRLTRGEETVSQAMDAVILDPRQNIRLQPGDVLTALFQPFTFTALGAVGLNAEVPFEGTGLTVAQALGRVGGLQDSRADIRGVFIFRLEDPAALGTIGPQGFRLTPDGRLPVIYKLNMSDPRSFFIAQSFPIRNGDVVYVSNAPVADIQKFVTIVSSMAYSIIGIGNAVQ